MAELVIPRNSAAGTPVDFMAAAASPLNLEAPWLLGPGSQRLALSYLISLSGAVVVFEEPN